MASNQQKIQLNDSQKKAVEFSSGPLLVVAGAGTGKTRVITQRVKHIIESGQATPNEILALTFTDKASSEMLLRLGDVMPLGYEEPWIYTFHAFADRLLKLEGLELGLDPAYKILSGPEQWLLFRKNIFEFDLKYFRPLGNPTKFVSAIVSFISRLQDENILPDELHNYALSYAGDKEEKERWLELAHIYQTYEALKVSQSKMDFGDLILWSIRLFQERPNILKKYQKQFKHILVDEFQDTNFAQYELVKLLFPAETTDRTLLAVGDDSQSIYKFRGAAVSNILDFREDFPEADMITLLQNYRSTQAILDPAYKLIQNNNPDTLESKLGISKELKSEAKKDPIKPKIVQLDTLEDEVEYVIGEILEILGKEPDYRYKDFAILARANNHLDPFVLALRKYGLPYQLVGNRGLYDRDEVRDIIAFLRVLVDPNDTISLYRVMNIDSLDIPNSVITKLLSDARRQKVTLWDLLKNTESGELFDLNALIENFQERLTKDTPSELVYRLVNEINYLKPFLAEETIENQLCIKNLDLFLEKVKKFEVSYRADTKEIPTIIDFVDHLDLLLDAGENPAQAEIEDIDTINLLTVHASKGLEFPVIFMINLVSDRFPTRNRKDAIEIPDDLIREELPGGNAHIQEERRLFYVGMTRAESYLYMVCGKNYGGKREKRPSGYLEETGIKIEQLAPKRKDEKDQPGLFGIESGFRDPKVQKIKNFEPTFLSYSQVDAYNTCPLKYKYRYVLSIPTPPSHTLSYGNTIHDTLRDFHSALMLGQEVTLDSLLEMYERNWQPLGYLDAEHRNLRFEEGKELLKSYYAKNKEEPSETLAVEKSFNLRIGGVKFYGKIDRIDKLSDGVEIIDYKTGTPKDQKYVDKDAQVAFYQIAAEEALGMNPKKLTYYYLDSGEKISTTRTSEELDKKKEEVVEVIDKMKKGEFNATPGMHCSWCDFKDICPFSTK